MSSTLPRNRPTSERRRRILGASALGASCGGLGTAWGQPSAPGTQKNLAQAFDTVRDRMRADAMAESGPGQAAQMLSSQEADGSWKDVDYADQGVGTWRPMAHLERLRRMARALAESTPTARSNEMASAMARGLDYWLTRKPRSGNWWHNTIGQQRELVRIVLLAPQALPPELTQQLLAQLVDPTMVPAEQATGQNRVWYATQQLVRGALARQPADLVAASSALASTLRITLDEGIQPDFSFHQHGPQLYSGGYGLGLMNDVTQAASWLHATPWALPADALDVLARFGLEGIAPLVRGRWLDWSARGREFTRNGQDEAPKLLSKALKRLGGIVPSRKSTLENASQALASDGPSPNGTYAFWRSDFLVHRTQNSYFSVKLCSTRTIGTESGNGENIKGYWLPFGVTYLLRRGDEYENLPAVWNWSELPGLTAPDRVPVLKGYQTHDSAFVGVLGVGEVAIAAMHLEKAGTQAKRTWFFLGDLMVALGSGIRCSEADDVFTTLNQCRLVGRVHASIGPINGATSLPPACRWLQHDGLTYMFYDPGQGAEVLWDDRAGEQSRINASEGNRKISAQVLTIRIRHGKTPTNGKYAYGVFAGSSDGSGPPESTQPTILANSDSAHAIEMQSGVWILAVLHNPTSLAIDQNTLLTSDSACMLSIHRSDLEYVITLADPKRRRAGTTISIRFPNGKSIAHTFVVPTDAARPYYTTWSYLKA